MFTIKNKQTSITVEDNKLADYAFLLKQCVSQVNPQQGVTVTEMAKAIRLLDVIEKGGKTLKVEDADFVLLKEKVESMQWSVINRDIAEFGEYITGLNVD